MKKRNFILLTIVLIIIAIFALLLFFWLNREESQNTGASSGTNFISKFNPFGKTTPTTPPITKPIDVSELEPQEPIKTKLFKVSSMPVAGFTTFLKERLKEPVAVEAENSSTIVKTSTTKKTTKPKETIDLVPAVRYVEKARGFIYQTYADKIEERQFSKTIVPKVHEAFFGNSGLSIVMRYLRPNGRDIETFVGSIPKEYIGDNISLLKEIKGIFLPNNVKNISISPNGLQLFYLFENGEEVIGTVLNFSDNRKNQIFSSSFTEWLSEWPTEKYIMLTTKPSYFTGGDLYSYDINKRNLSRVFGEINGLTTLVSPNGKSVLFSNNNLSLNIYDTDTREVSSLNLSTLPEKCAWSKTGESVYCAVPKSISLEQYPDAWYMGKVSFNDQIWKIDPKTKNTTLLVDPITEPKGEEIDGTNLSVDQGENYLFFINKKDSFLWKLNLKD